MECRGLEDNKTCPLLTVSSDGSIKGTTALAAAISPYMSSL